MMIGERRKKTQETNIAIIKKLRLYSGGQANCRSHASCGMVNELDETAHHAIQRIIDPV
jgi:hypothetical protein